MKCDCSGPVNTRYDPIDINIIEPPTNVVTGGCSLKNKRAQVGASTELINVIVAISAEGIYRDESAFMTLPIGADARPMAPIINQVCKVKLEGWAGMYMTIARKNPPVPTTANRLMSLYFLQTTPLRPRQITVIMAYPSPMCFHYQGSRRRQYKSR